MGTTGIVYTTDDGQSQTIRSVVQNFTGSVNMKIPTTLHIYQPPSKDLFADDVMERTFFGEAQPASVSQYIERNPNGTVYAFHGLKTVVYQLHPKVSPINAKSKSFDSMKIFTIALKLIKKSIFENRKDKTAPYKMVFLIPANSKPDLKDQLKDLITDVFNELKSVNLDDFLFFLKEPIAATAYSIEELKKANVDPQRHGKNKYSRIAIFDLGGGTCDFNLVQATGEQYDQLTNNACFAGGYNVDDVFMDFIELMFPNSSPGFKSEALKSFGVNKKKNPLQQWYLEIKQDDEDADTFASRLTGIFLEAYEEDELLEAYEAKELVISVKLMQICFQEVVRIVRPTIEAFLQLICQDDAIDNIIVVGGFSESQIVMEMVRKCVSTTYREIKQKYKYTNEVEVNEIAQRSLAIIKGGLLMCQRCGGNLTDLTMVTTNIVESDIFFRNGADRIPIFQRGQGITKEQHDVPQLQNLKVDKEGAQFARVTFVSVEEDDNHQILEKDIVFEVDVRSGGPFSVCLSINFGHQLFVKDKTGTKKYEQVKQTAAEKPIIYFLIDTTQSMEPYIRQLHQNLEKVMDAIGRQSFQTHLCFYSDYCYTVEDRLAVDTKTTSNAFALKKLLQVQADQSAVVQLLDNDPVENILPAFERVLKDEPNRQKTVIVVIGDCCAHTHIGCCCDQLPYEIDPAKRQLEVEKHYGCDKCRQRFVGVDYVLKDQKKIEQHRKRWLEVATKLKDVNILFVPVLQRMIKIRPNVIDKKHKYEPSGYSIIKTHRMLYLMGCECVQTIEEAALESFVDKLLEKVQIIMAGLVIANEK